MQKKNVLEVKQGAKETVQWVKALGVQIQGPVFNSLTLVKIKAENELHKAVLWSPQRCCDMYVLPTDTQHTIIINTF